MCFVCYLDLKIEYSLATELIVLEVDHSAPLLAIFHQLHELISAEKDLGFIVALTIESHLGKASFDLGIAVKPLLVPFKRPFKRFQLKALLKDGQRLISLFGEILRVGVADDLAKGPLGIFIIVLSEFARNDI